VSLRFDDDARHEYLEAIRFYGRAAERFVQAVDVAIEQIRGDPERFREVEPGVRSCRVPKFPYSILYGREDQGLFVRPYAFPAPGRSRANKTCARKYKDPALAPEEASEPHDNFAVAEGMRHAIVEVWAADTSGEMDKWISDSGTSC